MTLKRKIALVGASGRTGSAVARLLIDNPALELGAAVVSHSSKFLGQPVPGFLNVLFTSRLESLLECDGVIDFSSHEITGEVLRLAASRRIPCVIACTGHTSDELVQIEKHAKEISVTRAPNTSLGVALLAELASCSQKILGPDFKCEILDIHHAKKKDTPSGTAKQLASVLHGAAEIASFRGGDVIGEHTIYFLGPSERIEITHKAESRDLFAIGAIRLLSSLFDKQPGLYSAKDLLISDS